MKVSVLEKSYELKADFSEFKLKDLDWINPLLNKADYSHKFCIDWLLNASNIPLDILEKLDLEQDLKPVCEVSIFGVRTPDMFLEMDSIKVGGKRYNKRKELTTLSGMRIFLGNNNFKQFAFMAQMHDINAKAKEMNGLVLASLNAMLYGDDFTDKAIEERTKIFLDMSLLEATSGFFLFQKDLISFQKCLLEFSETRIKVVEKLEKILRLLLKITFGLYSPTRSRLMGYLIRITKHL